MPEFVFKESLEKKAEAPKAPEEVLDSVLGSLPQTSGEELFGGVREERKLSETERLLRASQRGGLPWSF